MIIIRVIMLKYVLCFGVLLLIVADVVTFISLKKFIKLHENELVENNIKGLMARALAITIISLFIGVIGIVLQFV